MMIIKTSILLATVCRAAADWSIGSDDNNGGWGNWGGDNGNWGGFGNFPSCANDCYSSAWSNNNNGDWQSIASSWCATPTQTSCVSASCTGSDYASVTSVSASLCSAYSSCSGSSTCSGPWGTYTSWPSGWNGEGWPGWLTNTASWSPSGWTGPWTTVTTTATATIPAQWTTVSGISSVVQSASTTTSVFHITSAKDTRAALVLTTSTISGTLIQGAAAAATGVPGAMIGVAGVMVGVIAVL